MDSGVEVGCGFRCRIHAKASAKGVPVSTPHTCPRRCATVRLCAKASTLSSGMGMSLAQPLLEHLMVWKGHLCGSWAWDVWSLC